MARRVAITGAAGHLGRVLIDRLLDLPEVERILALDRVAGKWTSPKVEPCVADVRDPDLGRHLEGWDTLIHLAFIIETGARDKAEVESINIGGTQNTISAAAKAGVRQVIYASSIASYGFHPENVETLLTEEAPIRGNPSFYYTRTKAEVERWLDEFQAAHPDVAVARLRPSMFLGSGSKRTSWIGGRVFLFPPGPGEVPTHLTHQDDVAEAFMLALQKEARGAYNLASDEPLPFRDWGRLMGKRAVALPRASGRLLALGYRLRLSDMDPGWYELAGSYPILVTSEKAKRELGWRPRYPTTAVALRAVTGRSTALASPATRLLLGSMATATRFLGSTGKGSEHERYESRSISGSLNFLLTGERPSEWRAEFAGGEVGIYPGLDPRARATTILADETFHKLLAGKLSHTAAQMTGKVRFQGDGDYSWFLGALVQRFKTFQQAGGLRGAPRRAFARLVLSRSGVA